jgi:membrane-bound lytic murein transglycosylase D
MRVFIIFFIFLMLMKPCLAQSDTFSPSFWDDKYLKYDTLLYRAPIKDITYGNEELNNKIIKIRLDSLNKLTPIEIGYNDEIVNYISFYLHQRTELVENLLTLSAYYFPIFEEILEKNELPQELKYIPIIESALNPNARSPMGAVGLWQFMYFTAQEHDLKINSYLDERKDTYKATQAACDYFNKSYDVFNNWELAIASYNAGRGNVTKAIRRSGGKINYWEVRPFLPKETRNYMPAFIASIYVLNFAELHGIRPADNTFFQLHKIDSVHLKRAVKISHLAQVLNIEQSVLEDLNPMYRIKLIPHLDGENSPVFLPEYKWGVFLNNEDSIYTELAKMEEAEALTYPQYTDIEKIKYRVKTGDYLGKIANKYNCLVSDVMRWNDLKSTKIKSGQTLYIYRTIK